MDPAGDPPRESGSRTRQPWLHDLSICVDGNGTALSARDGSMSVGAAEGFFVDDQRAVSTFVVALSPRGGGPEDGPLDEIANASSGSRSEFFLSARHLGDSGPDPTVEVHRSRKVVGSRMVEKITVVSRAGQPLSADLLVILGGDGAEIGSVKAGADPGPALPVFIEGPATVVWAASRLVTSVFFDPEPANLVGTAAGVIGAFPLILESGVPLTIEVTASADRCGGSEFPAEAGSSRSDALKELEVEAGDPRLALLLAASLADLQSLTLTDPEAQGDVFAAAGTPWYLTLFGRDSIWTARMSLPLGTELAAGTLRALARRQGRTFDPSTAEAPGKIPHELRRAVQTDGNVGFSLPPVYYGTVDATALWVCLLHDAWRWGMAELDVRALLPNLRRAAVWLCDVAAPDVDGLIKYVDESGHGLVNQGWKDSGDSMRFRDGRIADAPIALLEAQAYAVEAARAAALLLITLGDGDGSTDEELAHRLVVWADALTHRIRSDFWVGESPDRYLAMAIDGHGCPVDGLGSNMGHTLGTGVLTAVEAASVASTLTAPALLGRYGIRTMGIDNGGYNPIGYHTGSVWVHDTAICALGLLREGHQSEAASLARRLLDAGAAFGYRFPELFSDVGALDRPAPYPASCRPQAWAAASAVALVSVALGLSVDVPGRTITVRPPTPAPFGAVRVRGVRVGDACVTVSIDGLGKVEVEGLPDGFTLIA